MSMMVFRHELSTASARSILDGYDVMADAFMQTVATGTPTEEMAADCGNLAYMMQELRNALLDELERQAGVD